MKVPYLGAIYRGDPPQALKKAMEAANRYAGEYDLHSLAPMPDGGFVVVFRLKGGPQSERPFFE